MKMGKMKNWAWTALTAALLTALLCACPVDGTDISIAVTGVTLMNADDTDAGETLALTAGIEKTLKAVIAPAKAANKAVTWASSTAHVTVTDKEDGTAVIKAESAGTATVTVTAADGNKTDSIEVTVSNPAVPVTGVTLKNTDDTDAGETLALETGNDTTLKAVIDPADADNKAVTWASSDPYAVTVTGSNGTAVITAIGPGTATITVTAADGSKTDSVDITVTDPAAVIAVTGVTLDQTVLTLEVGGTGSLTATVAPENAANKQVTWTSSDTAVATVTAGANGTAAIAAVNAGTATITVTTVDGSKTASATVTVNNLAIAVTSVTLDSHALELGVGETGSLTATIAPNDATNRNVNWTSSVPAVATVTGTGATAAITGVSPGTAVITVKSADNDAISATATVTVGYKLVIKTFAAGELNAETTPNTIAGGIFPQYPLTIQNADGGSFNNAAGTFLNNMTLAYFAVPATGDFSLTAKVTITGSGSGNPGFWMGALLDAPGITNVEPPFLAGIRHITGSSGAVRRVMRSNAATPTLRADNLQTSFAKAIGTEYRYVIFRTGRAYTLTMTDAAGAETFGTVTLNPSSSENGINEDLSVEGQAVYLSFIIANSTIEISEVELTLGD